MSFDPAKPADHSPVTAGELRDQLNALKGQIDSLPDRAELDATINSETAVNCDQVQQLSLTVSNPPTQAQVNKLNELIGALQH